MRKFQKEQLLDIFTSLHELHRECRDRMEQKEYQTVQTALSDCQEAAIQMGEAIEQLVGEGTDAVSFLEQYCERLYNLSVQIEDLSAQKLYKNLEEILIKAENAVKHMHVRKEVVFFPYKASMWDSLESVYLAAKEDENCDAYCVPIPYYDRRADGSIGQMHYEGNEYPKNIEVIDYRTYNLEERHPDAIYIHNPYDEWNHVTCVPERYFAKNLRNYTDQLVYIPYFVLDEIEPDDQARIEQMKHFCFTPGVIYSHKVIVQSEKMRQIYINEYIKAAKESGLTGEHTDRKYLEQKILGLGSPKFDKVLNTKKEDLDIPEEWLRVIEKPDGSWKKIVFYNTSINGLLQYNDKMLEKMQDVFKFFQENKEHVALLWRPHPLIRTTIESMRPQLWEEYSRIVEQYRNEGWGIYDDSADMDRAVILSDVYYGDGSSVVKLCEHAKKTVIIQNACTTGACPMNQEEICLNFRGYVRTENRIYFANMEFNGLFELDIKTGEIVHKHTFSGAEPNQFFCVAQSIVKYHNKMLFLMNDEKKNTLCYYNLVTGEEQTIDFPNVVKPSMLYCYAFNIDSMCWFIPMDMSGGIYTMNLDTSCIEKDETLSELLKNNSWSEKCVRQNENSFSFYDANRKEIILVDVIEKTKKSIEVPIGDVAQFEMHKKTIWLTQRNSTDVYEWNYEENKIDQYRYKGTDLPVQIEAPYIGLIYIEERDCAFLLGNSIGGVFKTNRSDRTIEIAFQFPRDFRFTNNKLMTYSYFAEVEKVDDELWFYPIRGNMIIVYNYNTDVVSKVNTTIQKNELRNYDTILKSELGQECCYEYEGIYSMQSIMQRVLYGTVV